MYGLELCFKCKQILVWTLNTPYAVAICLIVVPIHILELRISTWVSKELTNWDNVLYRDCNLLRYIFGECARVTVSVWAEAHVGLQVKRLLLFSDLNRNWESAEPPKFKILLKFVQWLLIGYLLKHRKSERDDKLISAFVQLSYKHARIYIFLPYSTRAFQGLDYFETLSDFLFCYVMYTLFY